VRYNIIRKTKGTPPERLRPFYKAKVIAKFSTTEAITFIIARMTPKIKAYLIHRHKTSIARPMNDSSNASNKQ
jgi:hypothetical protein